MKKFSLFSALVLLAMIAAASFAWTNRENILAHFFARQLHVPVTIGSLDIGKTSASMTKLWVGNPPKSKSSTAFSAETLGIEATLNQILSNPLIIDEIDLANIFVGIEFYDTKGEDTNWNWILEEKSKKKPSRDYLIRTLTLRNLTAEVMQADGKPKRYPMIKQMQFHNIDSNSGFPVDEIEKAIFNLMIKDLFQKLQLDQIFKSSIPLPLGGS